VKKNERDVAKIKKTFVSKDHPNSQDEIRRVSNWISENPKTTHDMLIIYAEAYHSYPKCDYFIV
jgi:hypothetical protein